MAFLYFEKMQYPTAYCGVKSLIDIFFFSDFGLNTRIRVDPVAVGGNLCVNPRVASIGTAIAPRDNPAQLTIPEEGTARITLAMVDAASSVPSADLVNRDATKNSIVVIADGLINDWHVNFQKNFRC
jgi:hypothetical protein